MHVQSRGFEMKIDPGLSHRILQGNQSKQCDILCKFSARTADKLAVGLLSFLFSPFSFFPVPFCPYQNNKQQKEKRRDREEAKASGSPVLRMDGSETHTTVSIQPSTQQQQQTSAELQ